MAKLFTGGRLKTIATREWVEENAPGGECVHPPGTGIPEAPADGKQYGRQNEQWTEIIPSEGALIGLTEQEVEEMFQSVFY